MKLYGSFVDEVYEKDHEVYRLNIIMEYCESSLMHDIEKRKKKDDPYTQEELQSAIYQLVEGFVVLEELRINHQDIKPHNILISDTGYKISDFNVSKTTSGISTSTRDNSIQGTYGYFSPELQKAYNDYKANNGPSRIKYSPGKSDVFSLGLTFLQMATLRSVNDLNLYENCDELAARIDRISYNEKIKNILANMLRFDYHDRLSFKQITSLFNNITIL